MLRRFCAAAAIIGLACGGSDGEAPARQPLSSPAVDQEEHGENQAPRIDFVALSTDQPEEAAEIEARFDAADPDRDPLTFTITWSHNGRVVQSGEERTFTPGPLEKGDRIELRVVASDGQAESAPAVASARVGNRAPVISQVLVQPSDAPKRGEPLVANPIASDADGDELEFEYAWLVNGRPARGGDEARFVSSETKRGDKVKVRVIARDSDDESEPAESAELTLVNSPPVFAKLKGFEPSGGSFRHQFVASDPDGDKGLRFRLGTAPRGMEIDPVLGVVTWTPTPDVTGVIPVQVEVSDVFGASSALRFEITLTPPGGEQAAAQPAAQAEAE